MRVRLPTDSEEEQHLGHSVQGPELSMDSLHFPIVNWIGEIKVKIEAWRQMKVSGEAVHDVTGSSDLLPLSYFNSI